MIHCFSHGHKADVLKLKIKQSDPELTSLAIVVTVQFIYLKNIPWQTSAL